MKLICALGWSMAFVMLCVLSGCGSSGNSSSDSSTTSTTTTLALSSSSVTTGTSVTLTATVSPTAATGTVTFYSGSTSLGSATLSSGSASLAYTFSTAGTYSITAVYAGNSTYSSSTSSAASLVVGAASTTTSLSLSSSSVAVDTDVTFTATVSSTAATGTVTFYSGTTALGTGTLSSGTATYTTTFSTAGDYSITAVYAGDSNYSGSTSSASTLEVTSSSSSGTSTTTTLTTASSTSYPGSLIYLTATVSPSAATGTVTFYEKTSSSTTALGSSTLSSGTATLNTHLSSTGSYTLYAVYNADGTYASSQSSSITQTVSSTSYPLTLSSYTATSSSMTVTTSASHTVTYTLYSGVVYEANPVSKSYETMNIYIPTAVDGTSVSGSKPVMFENGVGGYMSSTAGSPGTNGSYALAKGYVVVEPGCRGRDNGSSGDYFGVAPAAMVDLKAAVRFLRYNYSLGSFTGDVDHIISSGGSAGGALSALLGASGNSALYYPYLAAVGAADADDNVYAVGAWSPITNLDHADGAYEMEYSTLKYSSSTINSTLTADLISEFETYQDDLDLTDKRSSYGSLTHSNIGAYILTQYLEPSLEKYVEANGTSVVPSYATCTADSSTYGYTCTFTLANYIANTVGSRSKSGPAFDSFFDISSSSTYYDTVVNTACQAETLEFGLSTGTASTYSGTNCSGGSPRHFTNFSSEAMDGSELSSSMQTIVNMMNPMYYIMAAISSGDSSGVAKYWYIRDGAIATDTSIYVIMDLATSLDNLLGTSYVNAWEDWATGHNVNTDPSGFSSWCTTVVAAD